MSRSPRIGALGCARRSFSLTMLSAAALALVSGGSAAGDDWPQFLGPQRTGVSAETGLISQWPEGGPPIAWRVPGGVGMSGVAVQDGRALTLVQTDGRQRLVSLDAKTGRRQWSADLAPAYKNQMGDGPRATPTLDEDSAYVFTGDGTLAAVSLADGEIRWKCEPLKDHRGKVADYGMACSPLIVGDLVVVTIGAPDATVVAYQRKSGEKSWAAGNDPAGYSSPALLKLGGVEQVVAFTGASCLGVRPGTGELLWRYPFVTDYQCNIATPLEIDGRLFISSGESHGAALLEITEEMQVKEVWTSFGPRAVMKNEWQTSILHDGKLYGLDNVGSAGPVTHLACIDAATGKSVWEQPRFGKSNLISADGKLIFSTMQGELVLAKVTPEGYREIGRMEVLGTTRQAPSLSDGRVYLRDGAEIVCVDLRAEK